MKKYFKNNIFYQGDGKILFPLMIVYLVAFIFNYTKINNYFNYTIIYNLYHNNRISIIINTEDVFFLIIYLGIIYAITVGLFKRKKWSTFLSMPYSKLDIRKREFFILSTSIIIYILIFLLFIFRGYIQYYEVIGYIDRFYRTVFMETLRLLSISILLLGVISIVDTIFSNIYYIAGAILVSGIYFICFMVNFGNSISYMLSGNSSMLWDGVNIIIDYIFGDGREFRVYQILLISFIFIIIAFILIYISKKLTDKMLVENMNEGIIFSFPKKIAMFFVITLPGLIASAYIVDIIDGYYYHSIKEYKLDILRITIIIIGSFIVKLIFKTFKKEKKEVYY